MDAKVLLVVKRPDQKLLWILRIALGLLPPACIVWSILTSANPGWLVIVVAVLFAVLFVMVIYAAINTNPIILTESGISQKLGQTLYWHHLEGYTWRPLTKNFFRLDFQPSSSASILVQINQLRGSFRSIHSSDKVEVEKIFQQKGLREIV